MKLAKAEEKDFDKVIDAFKAEIAKEIGCEKV